MSLIIGLIYWHYRHGFQLIPFEGKFDIPIGMKQALMFVSLSIKQRRSEAYFFEFNLNDKAFICYYFGALSLFPTILFKERSEDIILDRAILIDLAMKLRKFIFEEEPSEDAVNMVYDEVYSRILHYVSSNNIALPIFSLYEPLRWEVYSIIKKYGIINFSRLMELVDLEFPGLSRKDVEEALLELELANLISLESIYGELTATLERVVTITKVFDSGDAREINDWRVLEVFLDPLLSKIYKMIRDGISVRHLINNTLFKRISEFPDTDIFILREGELFSSVHKLVYKIESITGELIRVHEL